MDEDVCVEIDGKTLMRIAYSREREWVGAEDAAPRRLIESMHHAMLGWQRQLSPCVPSPMYESVGSLFLQQSNSVDYNHLYRVRPTARHSFVLYSMPTS